MIVSILVACAENGVIGRDGDLPWRLSNDLKRFKRLTMDHAIIMGRKTYESIGRPLPGRRMIVLSRDANYQAAHGEVFDSLERALEVLQDEPEVFVVGGAEIYRLALPMTNRIYRTRVLAEVPGDTWFPELDAAEWQVTDSEAGVVDDRNEFPHVFETLEKLK